MNPNIIYEDNDVLVIDKPSGMVVNRAQTVGTFTLQDWMEKKFKVQSSPSASSGSRVGSREKFKVQKDDFYNRSGIVHRLDKDTSGAMILAKNKEAFINLQKQFQARTIKKQYLALVHGRVEPKNGTINMPIDRDPKDRKKFTVRLGGRLSSTFYKRTAIYVSKKYNDQFFSLLELEPKTGRTHQLRVHLKHIGFPIVADPIYLPYKKLLEDKRWCTRLFLHSNSISFFHPVTKKRITFTVPLPQKLNFKKLKLVSEP